MLEQKIEDLTRAVEALTQAMTSAPATSKVFEPDELTPVQSEPLPSVLAQKVVDEQAVKDLTLELSRAGHRDAIRDKLSEFGVKKITDLETDDAFAYYAWLLNLKGDA